MNWKHHHPSPGRKSEKKSNFKVHLKPLLNLKVDQGVLFCMVNFEDIWNWIYPKLQS